MLPNDANKDSDSKNIDFIKIKFLKTLTAAFCGKKRKYYALNRFVVALANNYSKRSWLSSKKHQIEKLNFKSH
jgi:hypothetical protein